MRIIEWLRSGSPIWRAMAVFSVLFGMGLLVFSIVHIRKCWIAYQAISVAALPDPNTQNEQLLFNHAVAEADLPSKRAAFVASGVMPLLNTWIFFLGLVYTVKTFSRTAERQRFETLSTVIVNQNQLRAKFASDETYTAADTADRKLLEDWIARGEKRDAAGKVIDRSHASFFLLVEQLGAIEISWHAYQARQMTDEQWRSIEHRTYRYMVQNKALQELVLGTWQLFMHPKFRDLLRTLAKDAIEAVSDPSRAVEDPSKWTIRDTHRSGPFRHWLDSVGE